MSPNHAFLQSYSHAVLKWWIGWKAWFWGVCMIHVGNRSRGKPCRVQYRLVTVEVVDWLIVGHVTLMCRLTVGLLPIVCPYHNLLKPAPLWQQVFGWQPDCYDRPSILHVLKKLTPCGNEWLDPFCWSQGTGQSCLCWDEDEQSLKSEPRCVSDPDCKAPASGGRHRHAKIGTEDGASSQRLAVKSGIPGILVVPILISFMPMRVVGRMVWSWSLLGHLYEQAVKRSFGVELSVVSCRWAGKDAPTHRMGIACLWIPSIPLQECIHAQLNIVDLAGSERVKKSGVPAYVHVAMEKSRGIAVADESSLLAAEYPLLLARKKEVSHTTLSKASGRTATHIV